MRVRKFIAGFAFIATCVLGASSLWAQTVKIDPPLLAKANASDAVAQVAVGEQYAKAASGMLDPEDAADAWKSAASWYRKAAEQGDIPGELHLAECLMYGRGETRDPKQAAEWYRKAAEKGDINAQGMLAMLYSVGQGVPRSDVDAYFWFDVAALSPSPNQQRYILNRQNVGTRITADEQQLERQRLKKWKAEHTQSPR